MKLAILLCILASSAFSHSSSLAVDSERHEFRRELQNSEENALKMENGNLIDDDAQEKHLQEVAWKLTLATLCLFVLVLICKYAVTVIRDVHLTLEAHREAERQRNNPSASQHGTLLNAAVRNRKTRQENFRKRHRKGTQNGTPPNNTSRH